MALLSVIFTFIIKDIGQSAVLLIFNELHFNFSVMFFREYLMDVSYTALRLALSLMPFWSQLRTSEWPFLP